MLICKLWQNICTYLEFIFMVCMSIWELSKLLSQFETLANLLQLRTITASTTYSQLSLLPFLPHPTTTHLSLSLTHPPSTPPPHHHLPATSLSHSLTHPPHPHPTTSQPPLSLTHSPSTPPHARQTDTGDTTTTVQFLIIMVHVHTASPLVLRSPLRLWYNYIHYGPVEKKLIHLLSSAREQN